MSHEPAEILLLSNGVTLVLAHNDSLAVTVSTHIAAGFRDEPAEHSGLAHLFEHLMFQGSAAVEPGEHFARIEAVGGRVGGHTRHDYTELFDVVPSGDEHLAIWLAAERLRTPRVDETGLKTQIDVVKAEIAQQIRGNPLGGFPWVDLPPFLYDTYPNTHDGYGDIDGLESTTVDQCIAFFTERYAPDNLVVTIEGGFDRDRSVEFAVDELGQVPRRAAAARAILTESPLNEDRHGERTAAGLTQPVVAVGFRLPDPTLDPTGYSACTMLAQVLTADPSLWSNSDDETSEGMNVRCGWFDRPLDARDPDAIVFTVGVGTDTDGARVLVDIRRTLSKCADVSRPLPALDHAHVRRALAEHRDNDTLGFRGRRLGSSMVLFGDTTAGLRSTESVTRADIAAAASELLDAHAATYTVRPGR